MKKNKILISLLVFVAFIGGAAWSYLVIKQLDHGTILTSGSGGNYTINENSISAAVDKVYDATVVVASSNARKHRKYEIRRHSICSRCSSRRYL